jgi:hypothetical protein
MMYVPPPKPNPIKKAAKAVAGGGVRAFIIGIVVVIIVAGASFYAGWRIGYRAGQNNYYSGGGCINLDNDCRTIVEKPVIYLYPTKTEPVTVHLDYPAGFRSTDPSYSSTSGWQVLASPNGNLTDLSTGEHYPYLFWEGNPAPINYNMTTGFVVPGSQTEAFLRQELPTIGLSPSETTAFIAFWEPRMNGDTYNLIHFAGSEYTNYAKLTVSPQPNSELRVFMVFQPLSQPVSVTPQTFSGFQRKGFTLVEWGGTELRP